MNLMEAEYVRKKYRIIRASLLEDSVEFESSLVKIEEAIKKQEVEINRLRNIYGEALDLRDVTKGMLVRQEVNAINTAKAREKELQNLRRRVDERRLELDRLERQIFSTGRTLMHQDSVSSLEGAPSSTEDSITKITDALEETFDKLKAATGETEPEDVLKKFLSQKKTLSRLSYLRGITEGEKQELQKKKDFMIAELEAFKFAEVKDNEQNVEECEKAKQEIQDDVERRQKLDAQVQKMTQQLCDIRSILSSFCDQLKDASGILLLPDADILKVVETLENQIKNILDRIGEEDDPCKKMKQQKDNKTEDVIHPLENEQIISVKAAESKSSVLVSSETDDEEEVPTRGFLKRQAQIIVDAKSRRKQFPMGTRTKKILTIK
ncbi:outer dynein arm-docking complex subunit 3 [Periplaneta americana]|uniref:outer dynein arm-docking complex subunit 3 n=1 Tax=Periplaneta americana TaxID=6978 RepID=UPI0037E8400D